LPGIKDEEAGIDGLHGSLAAEGNLSDGAADVLSAAAQAASLENAAK
jgi:hypothetical protein